MNKSVLLLLIILASCSKNDFVVEDVPFSFGENNAQPKPCFKW